MNAFTVTAAHFQGPLDVLLDLVEKRKFFINDVSLAAVTDEYIAYLNASPITLFERAQYLLVAATLLLIKSRSLLPDFELTAEEEVQVADLKSALERYAVYKKAAIGLREIWDMQYSVEFRKEPQRSVFFVPSRDCTLAHIQSALQNVVTTLPKPFQIKDTAVVEKTVSIEEMIRKLSERVMRAMSVSFKHMSAAAPRGEVVVMFLAILELVKQGTITAEQSTDYGDIQLEHDTVGVPNYGNAH